MMNRYLVESPSTKTILTYENGQLTKIESNPVIKANHLQGFVIKGILDETKIKILEDIGGTVTKLDVTFDEFWARYPHKVGKKEAKAKWNKMKEPDQQEAYNYIKTYTKQADRERVAYLYPATYLNQCRWEDGK